MKRMLVEISFKSDHSLSIVMNGNGRMRFFPNWHGGSFWLTSLKKDSEGHAPEGVYACKIIKCFRPITENFSRELRSPERSSACKTCPVKGQTPCRFRIKYTKEVKERLQKNAVIDHAFIKRMHAHLPKELKR